MFSVVLLQTGGYMHEYLLGMGIYFLHNDDLFSYLSPDLSLSTSEMPAFLHAHFLGGGGGVGGPLFLTLKRMPMVRQYFVLPLPPWFPILHSDLNVSASDEPEWRDP